MTTDTKTTCPDCEGEGVRWRVRTPLIDRRDPAYDATPYECERCDGDGEVDADTVCDCQPHQFCYVCGTRDDFRLDASGL